MEVTYRRNLHKSYMCIREQGDIEEGYELRMLEGVKVPYLLQMETIVAEGEKQYLYDISGKQQLEDYLSGKKMDYGMLWKLLFSIRELCFVLSDYLLREGGVCLEPEYVYVNLEDGSLYFTYLPFGNRNLPEAFERYMEHLLRKIDHQDSAAAELGYQVYQMCIMENANMQGILEGAIKKEKGTEPDAELEEKQERGTEETGGENIQEDNMEELSWEKQGMWKKILSGRKFLPENEPKLSWLLNGLKEKSLKESNLEGKALKERALEEKVSGKEYLSRIFRKETAAKKRFLERQKEKKETKEKENWRRENRKKENQREEGNRKENRRKEDYRKETNLPLWGAGESAADREPAHPTEILGARSQEPIGRLMYQGIHGCKDLLVEGEEFLLGKNKQQAAGIIEAEGISRLHARISREEGNYYLEDLNSTNGTYLNGEPVEYHQKRKLCKGDCIRFGAEEFLFS